jgi:hypothetical protein
MCAWQPDAAPSCMPMSSIRGQDGGECPPVLGPSANRSLSSCTCVNLASSRTGAVVTVPVQ